MPTGAGTANLTRQNVGLRIERRTLTVPGAPEAKAKAVIRTLDPLKAVEVLVNGAPAGTMFDAYAVQNGAAPYGRTVKLAHVVVLPDGTADVAAELRFFDSGFTSVVLVPTGQLPSGVSLSSATAVPVLAMAAPTHCSTH